jgi:hypothetical protein
VLPPGSTCSCSRSSHSDGHAHAGFYIAIERNVDVKKLVGIKGRRVQVLGVHCTPVPHALPAPHHRPLAPMHRRMGASTTCRVRFLVVVGVGLIAVLVPSTLGW